MEKTSAKSAISKRRKRDVTAGGRADRLLSYLFFYRTRCHWLYISPLLLSTMAKQRTEPLGRAHRSIDPLFMWIYPLKKRRGFFRPGKTPFFSSPAWGAYQISMLRRKRACRQPLYSFFLSFALNLYLLEKKSSIRASFCLEYWNRSFDVGCISVLLFFTIETRDEIKLLWSVFPPCCPGYLAVLYVLICSLSFFWISDGRHFFYLWMQRNATKRKQFEYKFIEEKLWYKLYQIIKWSGMEFYLLLDVSQKKKNIGRLGFQ